MADTKKVRVWARRVAAFERSGLSRGSWCVARGLNANTLDYWRRKLRNSVSTRPIAVRRTKGGSSALVPIVMESAAHAVPMNRSIADGGAALVEIALPNGTQIRALPGTDSQWLASVVQSLLAC